VQPRLGIGVEGFEGLKVSHQPGLVEGGLPTGDRHAVDAVAPPGAGHQQGRLLGCHRPPSAVVGGGIVLALGAIKVAACRPDRRLFRSCANSPDTKYLDSDCSYIEQNRSLLYSQSRLGKRVAEKHRERDGNPMPT
jgi:hypothetical protein